MGFSDLPPVEKVDVFLDAAFKAARENAREHTLAEHEKSPLDRTKTLGIIKINTVNDNLVGKLDFLIAKYPNFDNLSEFYTQLLKHSLNFKQLKKSLGALGWLKDQIRKFSRDFLQKVKRSNDAAAIDGLTKQYYGRISSLVKQVKKDLHYLHGARQILRDFPSIKEELFTICIAGFPNVGKSTILSKLTTAKPEINSYAFTTTKLNIGYMVSSGGTKMQFIDTPGTLNREDLMNPVERHAFLAIRYVADLILYVFDLTENCGYSVKDQQKLFKTLKATGKPMLCYLSKTDLLDDMTQENFERTFEGKKIPLCTTQEELKDTLQTYQREIKPY